MAASTSAVISHLQSRCSVGRRQQQPQSLDSLEIDRRRRRLPGIHYSDNNNYNSIRFGSDKKSIRRFGCSAVEDLKEQQQQLEPMFQLLKKEQVSGYCGLLIGSPVILYEIIGFVLPGLTRSERRFLLSLLLQP